MKKLYKVFPCILLFSISSLSAQVSGVISANTNCSNFNGAIDVSVNPPGVYTYLWSGGEMTEDISGLAPGPYSVTVTDLMSNTQVANFIVPNNPVFPGMNGKGSPDTCTTNSGFIDLYAPTGPTPFTFLWSNGQTSEDLLDLVPGTYMVTITGSNGCTSSSSYVVGNIPLSIHFLSGITANTICVGGNGEINQTTTPIGFPYSYTWSNGATTEDITDLTGGSYSITATYGTCMGHTVIPFTVPTQEDHPNIFRHGVYHARCGLANGFMAAQVMGGGGPDYTFEWSTGEVFSGPSDEGILPDLLPGYYEVTVTSANGCTATYDTTVENSNYYIGIEPLHIVPTTICEVGNGSIDIQMTPSWGPNLPNFPYTYEWSNGATTEDITNLSPGEYTITATYVGTCFETATFLIEDHAIRPNLNMLTYDATCGMSNGSINITTLPGGVPPYTYSWLNGETTQDLSNIPPDFYELTVTASNGCTTVVSTTIDDDMVPMSLNGNTTNNISCDTAHNTGKIVLYLAPASLSVLWSTGSSATTLSNLAPGDYTVTVSAGGTCTLTETFSIADTPEYPFPAFGVTPVTCGLANGAIDLQVNGDATPPFSYLWSNGAVTQDISGLQAGAYIVTVTSSTGCSTPASLILSDHAINLTLAGTPTGNNSCGTPSGAIDLNVTPLGNNYAYIWSNTAITPDLNNLASGTYTVTVSLGNCVKTNSYTIPDNTVTPTLGVSALPASCGTSTGAADATVASGTAPFTYSWSNSALTEDLNNLLPGDYSVTVTDSFHCSSSATVSIPDNLNIPTLSAVAVDINSCLSATGALDLSVSPAGIYAYAWSNSISTEDLANLTAGTYTVTVSQGNTCSSSASFTVNSNSPAPSIVSSVSPALCGDSNGAIDLNLNATNAPYTFNWSIGAFTEDITDLASGNYLVTVTGANGCSAEATINVPSLSSTFNLAGMESPASSCSSNNGAIDLNVNPPGAYTYSWSNGALTQDISALQAGDYTVSVTDANGCLASSVYSIQDVTSYPVINSGTTAEICNLGNGAVNLGVSGGVLPYTFHWSDGETNEDLTNIAGGAYTVTVSGANGCSSVLNVLVPENTVSIGLSGLSSPSTNCIVNNGSIQLNVTPSAPGFGLNYTYTWSNNAATPDLTALAAGTYTVLVSAGGTCVSTATFSVASNTPSPVLTEALTAAFCGDNSGSIDMTVNGGQTPYTYHWSNGAGTEDLTSIVAGTYTLTVVDAAACTSVSTYALPENVIIPDITGSVSPDNSCISNDGAINVNASPAMTYTYNWSGGQSFQNLSSMGSGLYTVTVSAGGTCTATSSFSIPDNTVPVNLSATVSDVLCFGDNLGAINVSVNSGTGPFVYNWSPGIPGNPQSPANLPAGNYLLTVSDAFGCSGTNAFSIAQPASSVQINCALSSNASSPGATDGSAAVNLSGGTGPYTVNWSPGGSQSNVSPGNFPINNLGEGSYNVTVTDANACPALCNFSISTQNCATSIGLMQSDLVSRCGPGCLTVNYDAAGQTLAPTDVLQFILHTGSGNQIVQEIARSNQPVFCFDPQAMSYGTTYYVSVAAGSNDGSGNVALGDFCAVVAPGTPIVFWEHPLVSVAAFSDITCEHPEVNLTGTASLPNAAFHWETHDGEILGNTNQSQITATAGGLYTVIVEVNGCIGATNVSVNENLTPPSLILAPHGLLTCVNEMLTLNGSTPLSGIDLSWVTINGSDTTLLENGSSVDVTSPGTYHFIGINPVNGCSAIQQTIVTADIVSPIADAGDAFTLGCNGAIETLNGSGSSGAAGLGFLWTSSSAVILSGAATATPSIDEPGLYQVLVTNPGNGCTDTDEILILSDGPQVSALAIQPACFGDPGVIRIESISGGKAPIQYSLDNGQHFTQETIFEDLDAGVYTVMVQDANGCTTTAEATINSLTALQITLLPEAVIKIGEQYQFDVQLNVLPATLGSITWTPATGLSCDDCLNPLASPAQSTLYEIKVQSDAGCEARAKLNLVVDRRIDVYVPNIFSPGGDGTNDIFTIFANTNSVPKVKSFQVYSRWGELLWEAYDFVPNQPDFGWDGRHQGRDMSPGVFVWHAVLQVADGRQELRSGDVTLKR